MGRVKKPKEKEVYKPTDKQVGEGAYYNLREIKGYNDGRNKMDKFRKQELNELADVGKIANILIGMLESHAIDGDIVMQNPNLDWKSLGKFYAQEISAMIKEKI